MPLKINSADTPEKVLAVVEKVAKKTATKYKPKEVKKSTRGRLPSINYNSLRLQWLRNNINLSNGEQYSLDELASDYGVSGDSVKRMARAQGWHDTLEKMREEIAEQAHRQLIAATGFDEVAIRKKHAKFANIAMNKAILGLMQLDPSTLSPHALVLLLQLGLAEEKKAYGMVETITGNVNLKPGEMQESVQSAAQQAMDILNKKMEKTIDANGEYVNASPSV